MPHMATKTGLKMKTIRGQMLTAAVVSFAFAAFLQFTAHGAGNKAKTQTFSSFCGFAAGESKSMAKKLPKDPLWPDAKTTYAARKSFRKFKEVELEYDDKSRLYRVSAYAWLKNTKLAAGLKELDATCKELGKAGFAFPPAWTQDNVDSRSKTAYDAHETQIEAICGYQQEFDGTLLEIHVKWRLHKLLHNPAPVRIKGGTYGPKTKIPRTAFIEKAFGVKFGQDVSKSIKLDEFDEEGLEELAKIGKLIGDKIWVERNLASPFCGFDMVRFHLDDPSKKCLRTILLSKPVETAQSVDAAKATHEKSLSAFKNWLAIDGFNTDEHENVQEFDQKVDDNTFIMAGKTIILDSACENDGLKVKLRSIIHVPKKGSGISVTRNLAISPRKDQSKITTIP